MIYDAIVNGTDLFLDPTGDQTQFDTYSKSVTFRNAVREACHRYLYVIANYSAVMNGFSASSEIVSVMPWWQLTLFSLKIAFFGLGAAAVLMLVLAMIAENKNK